MTQTLVRLALLLTIFASVFLLTQVALGAMWRQRARLAAVNARMRMIREGDSRDMVIARLRKNAPAALEGVPAVLARPVQAFQRLLFAAAVPFAPLQILLAMAGLFTAVLLGLLILAATFGFGLTIGIVTLLVAVAGSIGVVIPMSVLGIRAQHRRKRIEEQFPVALDVFVRALRSGHPIASAIDLLTQEMEDPIGSEFGLVADETSYGANLVDALQEMADRWDSADMRMFVVSLALQSETGGNLAEILDNLADVIRARTAMYLKVRALSSEGRLTGWMLTILPILSFIGMFAMNPGFYLEVARDPIFIFGFSGLIVLYFIGLLIIRRMTDLKV